MPIIDATETVGFKDSDTVICLNCMKKGFYQNVFFNASDLLPLRGVDLADKYFVCDECGKLIE